MDPTTESKVRRLPSKKQIEERAVVQSDVGLTVVQLKRSAVIIHICINNHVGSLPHKTAIIPITPSTCRTTDHSISARMVFL